MTAMCDPSYKSLIFKVRDILGDSFSADEYREALAIATHRPDYSGDRKQLAEFVAEEIRNIRKRG